MRACWARSCPGGRCPLAPWTGPRAGCGSRPTELGADPAGHRGQGVVGGAATTGLRVRAVVSVVLGGLGGALTQLGVQAQQTGAVVADELHAADDLRDGGLLLDLRSEARRGGKET